jgi:hypothetical protein
MVTALKFPDATVRAGTPGQYYTQSIPDRDLDDLSEDTYSYEIVSAPSWVSLNYITRAHYLSRTDSIESIANNDIGYISNRWKLQYGYVKPVSLTKLSSQILDSGTVDGYIVSKNPKFANVDVFGVDKFANPFQYAYTRIAYDLYGFNWYSFAQHVEIVDECGGSGWYIFNNDRTLVKLSIETYPWTAPWITTAPSRFRALGGSAITRIVTPEMRSAWEAYWAKWDGFNYNSTDFAPRVDFARGKLYRLSKDTAVYEYTSSIQPVWTPPSDTPAGEYEVTIKTINNATGQFALASWKLNVIPEIVVPPSTAEIWTPVDPILGTVKEFENFSYSISYYKEDTIVNPATGVAVDTITHYPVKITAVTPVESVICTNEDPTTAATSSATVAGNFNRAFFDVLIYKDFKKNIKTINSNDTQGAWEQFDINDCYQFIEFKPDESRYRQFHYIAEAYSKTIVGGQEVITVVATQDYVIELDDRNWDSGKVALQNVIDTISSRSN